MPTVVFYILLLPLTIVRHDSIFQLIALKLWSANTSSGNYSCRERHAFVRFPNVLMQLRRDSLFELSSEELSNELSSSVSSRVVKLNLSLLLLVTYGDGFSLIEPKLLFHIDIV
ncbi:hypothetical protein Tco_0098427 [Tanacetum coccineum]